LRNIRAALESDGRAIILVPNGPGLFGTLDGVLGHFRRYTRDQLVEACVRAGFHVEQVIKFNRVGSPAWWWNGKILKRKTFGFWQIKMLNMLVPLVRPFDRFLPLPHLSWIVVLRPEEPGLGQETPENISRETLHASQGHRPQS
jgi:hypothetical protein